MIEYECRFCGQSFLGHPGDVCPDCGANDDEFSEGYLSSPVEFAEVSGGDHRRDSPSGASG